MCDIAEHRWDFHQWRGWLEVLRGHLRSYSPWDLSQDRPLWMLRWLTSKRGGGTCQAFCGRATRVGSTQQVSHCGDKYPRYWHNQWANTPNTGTQIPPVLVLVLVLVAVLVVLVLVLVVLVDQRTIGEWWSCWCSEASRVTVASPELVWPHLSVSVHIHNPMQSNAMHNGTIAQWTKYIAHHAMCDPLCNARRAIFNAHCTMHTCVTSSQWILDVHSAQCASITRHFKGHYIKNTFLL